MLLRSDPGFSSRSDPPCDYVSDVMCGSRCGFLLSGFGLLSGAVFEPEAVVNGLQDVTVMGEAIEERGRHLGVAEHAGPFAEAEVGGDNDAGALVEFAQQMEQQSAARCAERKIAKLVEDHEIGVDQAIGDLPSLALRLLLFQRIDQLDRREEPHPLR